MWLVKCCCRLNNTQVCDEHLFVQVCTCTGRNHLPIFHCTNVHTRRHTRLFKWTILDDVTSQNELTTLVMWLVRPIKIWTIQRPNRLGIQIPTVAGTLFYLIVMFEGQWGDVLCSQVLDELTWRAVARNSWQLAFARHSCWKMSFPSCSCLKQVFAWGRFRFCGLDRRRNLRFNSFCYVIACNEKKLI